LKSLFNLAALSYAVKAKIERLDIWRMDNMI